MHQGSTYKRNVSWYGMKYRAGKEEKVLSDELHGEGGRRGRKKVFFFTCKQRYGVELGVGAWQPLLDARERYYVYIERGVSERSKSVSVQSIA